MCLDVINQTWSPMFGEHRGELHLCLSSGGSFADA